MNIAHLLLAARHSFPDRPAISVGMTLVCDYQTLVDRVSRLATILRSGSGDIPGQRIAIVATNCPAYIELMWAAWYAGLCIVPVNAKLHPREVAYIVEHSGATLCFVSGDLIDAVGPVVERIPGLKRVLSLDSQDYVRDSASPMAMQVVAPKEPAWLFYTSGTTGRPKGATLSHHNLLEMSLRNFADIDLVTSEDAILHVAPLSHATGLFSIFHAAKASNQILSESRAFHEEEVSSLINRYPNCTLFLAPTMLNRLTTHPASERIRAGHLKTLIYGGAPMYVEDLKRALRRFGPCLWQGYGQGETPNTITYLSKGWHAKVEHPQYNSILATVGIPRTGVSVRVVDNDDRELPPGEIGEVTVRSEVTMSGYWNNPEATAASLKDGWLHTGDLASFDVNGFLTLKDRSKDVIISGGSNIYPREVEEVLLLHSAVQEVSVVGRPSLKWGEEVVAFVVRRGSQSVIEDELDALCLANIARFKRPKAYIFLEALPKSNYGKILKTELRLLMSPTEAGGHEGMPRRSQSIADA